MHAQRTATAVGQDLEVSPGLRGFHHSESVFLAGDGYVVRVVTRDLQEHAAVGAAFVGLSSRMQKARAEAEARSNVFSIANGVANFLQLRFVRFIHLNIAEHGEVIARANAAEMGAEIIGQRIPTPKCTGVS